MKIIITLTLFLLVTLALILSSAGWTWPREANPFDCKPK